MSHRVGSTIDGVKSKYFTRTKPFKWQRKFLLLKRDHFFEMRWKGSDGNDHLVVAKFKSYNWIKDALWVEVFQNKVPGGAMWMAVCYTPTIDFKVQQLGEELSEKETVIYAI
jgi:hypothetical protein